MLNEEDKVQIFALAARGMPVSELAEIYGISKDSIYEIIGNQALLNITLSMRAASEALAHLAKTTAQQAEVIEALFLTENSVFTDDLLERLGYAGEDDEE